MPTGASSKDIARVGTQLQEMLAAQYEPGTRTSVGFTDDDSELETTSSHETIEASGASSEDIGKMKTQLRTMLAAQYSFGVTVVRILQRHFLYCS